MFPASWPKLLVSFQRHTWWMTRVHVLGGSRSDVSKWPHAYWACVTDVNFPQDSGAEFTNGFLNICYRWTDLGQCTSLGIYFVLSLYPTSKAAEQDYSSCNLVHNMSFIARDLSHSDTSNTFVNHLSWCLYHTDVFCPGGGKIRFSLNHPDHLPKHWSRLVISKTIIW